MQKFWIALLSFGILLQFNACEEYIPEDMDNTDDNGSLVPDGINEDENDYDFDTVFTQIWLNQNSITIDSDSSGAIAEGSMLTLTQAGTYQVSGTLTDGRIIVDAPDEDEVKLILNGIDVSCSTSAPLVALNADKLIIKLADDTENILTDGSIYQDLLDNEPNAALFSKTDLTLFGNGSLLVNANFEDGISSKDGLIIKSGIIQVNADDDGIRGKDYLYIYNGEITVVAGGDGFKSDNTTTTDAGYITIDSGTFKITSGGDAIAAYSQVEIKDGDFALTSGGGSDANTLGSAKGIKSEKNVLIQGGSFSISSADDGLHSNQDIQLNGGTLEISSGDDGLHADESISLNDCTLKIGQSYEGIESKTINLANSQVEIIASDDGFNATAGAATESNDNSSLSISSGFVCVNSSRGDALDANGSIYISGGTVLAHGPSSDPEVGMDFNGVCKISGGTFLVSGTNSFMTQAPSSSSTQYSVLVLFSSVQEANTLVNVRDEEGNNILTFAPARDYGALVFSTSELSKGSSYQIYLGGECTGSVRDGYYYAGTYSGGELYEEFTISSIVTTLGSSSGGGGGHGGPPGGF